MGWDDELFAIFDDLESQAGALFALERDLELVDRARAEYATVTLASRLLASVGRPVLLDVVGVGQVRGELRRASGSWSLVEGHGQEWIVPHSAVAVATGLSPRSLPEAAWSPLSRLGLGAALRRLADEEAPCVLRLRDGASQEALIERIGKDFVEVHSPAGQSRVFALASLAAVQSRDQSAAV